MEKAIAEVLDFFAKTNRVIFFGMLPWLTSAMVDIRDFKMEAMRYVSSKRQLDRGTSLMRDFENFVRNSPELKDQDIRAEDAVSACH